MADTGILDATKRAEEPKGRQSLRPAGPIVTSEASRPARDDAMRRRLDVAGRVLGGGGERESAFR